MMPAPYSDNMYSDMGQDAASAAGDDRDDALSPTDGYFHASETSDAASSWQHVPGHGQQNPDESQQQHRPTWSNVPSVPNVLVEDPTLQDKSAAKAKEAEEERWINNTTAHASAGGASAFAPHTGSSVVSSETHGAASASSAAYAGNAYATSSTTSGPAFVTSPSHHHRRSVEENGPLLFTGHSTRLPSSHAASETASNALNSPRSQSQPHQQSHLDAPPAYSPSPSSPPSGADPQGYHTFAPTPSGTNSSDVTDNQDTMGVPEEHQALLPRHPQSMGGAPNGPPASKWQQLKNITHSPNARQNIRTLLGIAVILSIFFAIFGGISLSGGHRYPKVSTSTNAGPIHNRLLCYSHQTKPIYLLHKYT
jgi:hypothetical protein